MEGLLEVGAECLIEEFIMFLCLADLSVQGFGHSGQFA